MSFIQLIIGYVIARIILAIVMVPHYFKGEIYSPYQLFSNAFGENARHTAGGFFLLSETLAAGVRVYVACIPVKLMLGDKLLGAFAGGDPILGAILLFVLISLVYTFVGGVKAVIWTDAVQFALFLLGGLVHVVVCAARFSRAASRGSYSHGRGRGKTALAQCPRHAGSVWREPMNIWMGVIGGTVMVMASHGAEQLIVQRVLACKNVRGRPQGAGLERGHDLSSFFDISSGRRDALGLLPKISHADRDSGNPPGQRHQGQRFRLSHFHVDGGAARPERTADRRHSGRGDVIGQLGLTALSSVSTMDFVKKALPGQVRRVFFAFQQSFDGVLGGGADPGGVFEPAGGIRSQCLFHASRFDQRRICLADCCWRCSGKPGRRVAGDRRDDRLAGRDGVDQPAGACRRRHRALLVHDDWLRRHNSGRAGGAETGKLKRAWRITPKQFEQLQARMRRAGASPRLFW